MALPRELKNFNLFADGNSLMGVAESVKLPKIAYKTEDYRGAGMPGVVELRKGLEKLELEWTLSGFDSLPYKQFKEHKLAGLGLRFTGAYQRDDTGEVQAVEIVVRGRHNSADPGDTKMGDGSKTVTKTACAYYKLTVDNQVLFEIDVPGMTFMVDGTDLMADERKALGL